MTAQLGSSSPFGKNVANRHSHTNACVSLREFALLLRHMASLLHACTYLHVIEGFHAELVAVLGYDLPLLLLSGLE